MSTFLLLHPHPPAFQWCSRAQHLESIAQGSFSDPSFNSYETLNYSLYLPNPQFIKDYTTRFKDLLERLNILMLLLNYLAYKYSIDVCFFHYHFYEYSCHIDCFRGPVHWAPLFHICVEEDIVLNSKRYLLACNGLPLPSPVYLQHTLLVIETASFTGTAWTCVVQGIWDKFSGYVKGLEARTGNENCALCHLT